MTETLPLFPLGAVLFPGMKLPLHVFEERYRLLLRRRLHHDPIFGVVLTRTGREVGDEPEIHLVGTAASLLKVVRYPDGRLDIVIQGRRRFRVLEQDWSASYLVAEIEWIDERGAAWSSETPGAVRRKPLTGAFVDYLAAVERATGHDVDRGLLAELDDHPLRAGYTLCALMPFTTSYRQRLLETPTPDEFLDELVLGIRRERELLLATGVGGAAPRAGSRFLAN